MQTQEMRVGDIRIDPKLTKLRPVNGVFVSRYRQAYRSGAKLPPPIIQKGTNRCVSGNHRVTSLLAEYGPDHIILVIVKDFQTEREVIEEFIKENVGHGNALSGISMRALQLELASLGASPEEIASLFNCPVKKVIKNGEQTLFVIGEDPGERVLQPVKRGVPLEVQEITKEQYEESQKKDRGLFAIQIANQLIRHFKNGWILNTESNMEVMKELRDCLDEFLMSFEKAV